MNQALLYRPGSNGQLVTAFALAATIYLSVVAVASIQREVPVSAEEPFASIEGIELDAELSAPPQIDIPVDSPPAPSWPSDFVESPQPPPRNARQPAAPIRPRGLSGFVSSGNPRTCALSAPRPEYPYEARSRHATGSGVALVTVDPASGNVTEATMEQSIGNAILDNAAVSAFKRWRFKPGTVAKVRIPITFDLTGASY